MKIVVEKSISAISKSQWNSLSKNSIFTLDYDWLYCLEASQSTTAKTGWEPIYFLAFEDNILVGAILTYIKSHSYGEFIFDWQWANAYEQAGLNYYPKLVLAAALSPITGERILTSSNQKNVIENTLMQYIIQFAKSTNMSSIHCLFCPKHELSLYKSHQFIDRLSIQYHWHNQSFKTFDDYLNVLSTNRRKTIRQERRYIKKEAIHCDYISGNDITTYHLEFMQKCYQNTINKKFSYAYLNPEFFTLIANHYKKNTLLVLAKKNNSYIAGSLNFFKNNKLYGRYWGQIEPVKFLHFECCIYQLVEWSIKNNIKLFEAGAQGEHKKIRGFKPSPTYSAHLFFRHDANKLFQEYTDHEKNILKSSYDI